MNIENQKYPLKSKCLREKKVKIVLIALLRYEVNEPEKHKTWKTPKVPYGHRQVSKVRPSGSKIVYEDHDWFEERPVCDSRTSFVYPKAAINNKMQWR